MSKADQARTERRTPVRAASGVDPHARQPPDTKQRAIEHGAEEYYRREGSVAEAERAGQPLEGGDAEAGNADHRANGDRSLG